MGVEKIKISGVTKVATSLVGLVTLGVDAQNESVQIPLDLILESEEAALEHSQTAGAFSESSEESAQVSVLAKDAAVAAKVVALATNYAENHKARVVADGGTVRSLGFTNRVYEAVKDLLPDTELLFIPECGAKITDGKIEKLYNLVGTNDAVQATAANRPYVGGVIAPNEKAKLKADISQEQYLQFSEIQKTSVQEWAILCVFECNSYGANSILGGASMAIISDRNLVFYDGAASHTVMNYLTPDDYGKKTVLLVSYDGKGTISFSRNGVVVLSESASPSIHIQALLSTRWGHLSGLNMSFFALYSKSLSAYESQNLHAFLSTEFPAIETIAVGSQQIGTSNLEISVAGGVTIPEVQSAGTEGNAEKVVNGTFDSDTGWSKGVGWDINGGKANGTNVLDQYLYQNVGLQTAHVYKITYTVSNYTQGVVKSLTATFGPSRSANGTYQEIAQGGDFNIYFLGQGGFTGSIDNISIKEVGTELITAEADRTFSSDTGFWSLLQATMGGGKLNINATSSNWCLDSAGKTYAGKYKLVTISVYSITGQIEAYLGYQTLGMVITSAGVKQFVVKGNTDAIFRIFGYNGTVAVIDSISIVELGWSDSQYIYDQRKLAGDTDLQANIAAAMWCHYDNLPANGAIYGKLYNGFAVPVINTYAPAGFHVPSDLEWTMLSEYLGGNTVSGGKIKALYGGFNNANATNESGVSLLASGKRNADGLFYSLNSESFIWYDAVSGQAINFFDYYAGITTPGALVGSGFLLRLFSNTPHLEKLTYDSGLFSTDIASTPKSIRIPFGCKVTNIKCVTSTSVTAIEAKLFNYAGTELETLITGKACNATTKSFNVVADQTVSYTDNYVRVTATGNSGVGMTIYVTIEPI